MTDWYLQAHSVPRKLYSHNHTTSTSQGWWHKAGWVHGFMLSTPKYQFWYACAHCSLGFLFSPKIMPRSNHQDHLFPPILLFDVNITGSWWHDFTHCTAVTLWTNYVIAWMNSCTGVPNKDLLYESLMFCTNLSVLLSLLLMSLCQHNIINNINKSIHAVNMRICRWTTRLGNGVTHSNKIIDFYLTHYYHLIEKKRTK